MRLMRGSGLPGLSGMRPRRGPWIKPLLEATRADVEADLRAIGARWREDASNADKHYLRSRIRHSVVPALLAANGPGATRDALARGVSASARELRDAGRALASRARRLLAKRGGLDDAGAWVERSALVARPRAVRLAALRNLWRRALPRGVGLTRRHLDALLSLAAHGRSRSRVELPAGRIAECRDDRLVIAARRPASVARRDTRRLAPGARRATRGDAKLGRARRNVAAGREPGPAGSSPFARR